MRTPTYETCDRIDITDPILEKRLKKIELTVAPKNAANKNEQQSQRRGQKNVAPGVFPLLDPAKFDTKSRPDNAAILVRGR